MDLRTILTLLFYAVLLGTAFWVGSLLERNERKYKKYFTWYEVFYFLLQLAIILFNTIVCVYAANKLDFMDNYEVFFKELFMKFF